ncbi:questin oxidase family protein [Rhizobium sp. L1K21]|uniref:questin oxidase family protein n=1 Tax=Rhizobium sp. L1K21 TaxID=2954933 RepID=UPI002092D0E0|nr:questin oxidase family protein [Rhizobium sp. L1K21]MCO6188648.1 questin oxidase family protein [Rhizobium sp. L1K21]
MTNHISEGSLDSILDIARKDSVEFPYLLANHAPMVLIALERMGASPSRLAEWYAVYRDTHKLAPPSPSVAPIEAETWKGALGDRSREADYRIFFTGEVERLGIDAAIRQYLPHLIQGVAGSALHPLMRLAYAVLKMDKAESGAALGYWAACYLPMPYPGVIEPDTRDPAAILAAVSSVDGIRTYKTETDLLWHNIRAVAELPEFAPLIGRLKFDENTPKRMAETSLAVFAATMDFSALHAVTGMHWVRLVAPYIDDPVPLYRVFWQVIASLVPKIGFPDLPSAKSLQMMRELPAPDWADIKAAAIASSDEHDVSLVFSASQEEEVWGDRLYQVVAARRVGLIE